MTEPSSDPQRDPGWDKDVAHGRMTILIIAGVCLAAGAYSMVYDWGRGQGVAGVVRLLLEAGLFWAVWQGKGWAVNVAVGVSGLVALFGAAVFVQTWHPAMAVAALVFGGIAGVLGWSSAVRAYVVEQQRRREI